MSTPENPETKRSGGPTRAGSRLRDKLSRLPLVRRFFGEDRGVAAVEFALIVPVMVTAYLGSVDLTQAVMVDRKVSVMASAVGDLVAQTDEITNAEMSNIFDISASLLSPFDASTIKLRVSSLEITTDKQGTKRKAKVQWSDGKNQTAYPKNTEILVPESIAANATTVIYTEATYVFHPLFGQIISSTITLEDEYYHVPRVADQVERK
ncbi:MAG: pilus assembly protein [Rhodobiaceae bacterium]|nr:pilus assembly protein [Rhodobiaceae bacterium]MCC0017131.1 pilus assembly protein [Rhodobiaceae bacterium]MCC0041935.1 pilus assembly protein [Rhodobiaceae bacterium]